MVNTNVSLFFSIHKLIFVAILWLLIISVHFQSHSQSTVENNKPSEIDLIISVKEYCVNKLNMDISENFFLSWAKSEIPNYYLYISKKDTLTSEFDSLMPYKAFGFNFDNAKLEKEKFDELGYSTHLYQTYGTSNAQLSNHLLSYSKESIAFIVFHEATHQHILKNTELPYSIVEAVCDLMGNYGTLNLSYEDNELSTREAKRQIYLIEDISIEINKLISIVESHNFFGLEFNNSNLQKKIRKLDIAQDRFKVERYGYEINTAYLIRMMNYTRHYFRLKKLLEQIKSLEEFLDFIITLPNDENECISLIESRTVNQIND